jgi:hypothetical protein
MGLSNYKRYIRQVSAINKLISIFKTLYIAWVRSDIKYFLTEKYINLIYILIVLLLETVVIKLKYIVNIFRGSESRILRLNRR